MAERHQALLEREVEIRLLGFELRAGMAGGGEIELGTRVGKRAASRAAPARAGSAGLPGLRRSRSRV